MMKTYLYRAFCFMVVAAGLSPQTTQAQSLPVGTPVLEDYYRRAQLLGKTDTTYSLTNRPIFPAASNYVADVFDPDSSMQQDHWFEAGPVRFANGLGMFQLLPVSWQQQYNSHHPYGWNDGAMIPAKGYQTVLSGGFYLKFGPLRIQLRPEMVYASNPAFPGFTTGHNDDELRSYYFYHNFIDAPERFGNSSYRKGFLGQSSVRLTFDPVSIGISNENIWWGPGIKNALILSNNAPGFKHLTFNTTKPVKTYIGSFEWQLVAGLLKSSGYPQLNVTALADGTALRQPPRDEDRYFTGFNFNYHPKWVPGLTLGLTRTFNAYRPDIKGFSAYFPFFTSYEKSKLATDGDPFARDQYTSVYGRWLFTKAMAEVYFEYALNDNAYNFRDFTGSPDHSRAYIFGLRKMMPLNASKAQYILFSGEVTQLSQTPDRLVRDAGGYYIHSEVRQGHTNLGQIMGAGTSSGGNLQSVDVSWVSGLKKLGVGFERYEHNVDFARTAFPDINGNSRKWVDFAFALQGEWNYKNLLFNSKLQYIRSLNYQWVLQDYNPAQYYIPQNDVSNLHAELGVTFRF